jgi:hypothetical protein
VSTSQMTACRGCGRPVYVSATSAADGPTCRECRACPDRVCLVCATPFKVRSKVQYTCSRLCSAVWQRGNVAREAAVTDELDAAHRYREPWWTEEALT